MKSLKGWLIKMNQNEKVIVKRNDGCRFMHLHGAIVGKNAVVQ